MALAVVTNRSNPLEAVGRFPSVATIDHLIDLATFHAYRLAGYALLNWAEDAAIMALMFC